MSLTPQGADDFSKLSYKDINSMAEELHKSAANMEEILEQVKILFSNIGNEEVWAGDAANETREEFDKLSAQFPKFSEAIDDCYNYLLSVTGGYKSVDKTIKSNVSTEIN